MYYKETNEQSLVFSFIRRMMFVSNKSSVEESFVNKFPDIIEMLQKSGLL